MMKSITLAAAALVLTAANASTLPAPDTLAERAKPCLACHAAEGRKAKDEYYPRLAGKPLGYLFNQMTHFRDGRRQHRAMSLLLENLSDAFLNELAAYFSELPASDTTAIKPPSALESPALIMLGDPTRNIPACVACHGDQFLGAAPSIPGLLGLPSDYISAQIGAWKVGTRKAASPDCMADIAKQLSPSEVSLIADWLSAQSILASARPAASLEKALPLRCGSIGALELPTANAKP